MEMRKFVTQRRLKHKFCLEKTVILIKKATYIFVEGMSEPIVECELPLSLRVCLESSKTETDSLHLPERYRHLSSAYHHIQLSLSDRCNERE